MCGRFAHYRAAIEFLWAYVSDLQTGLETQAIDCHSIHERLLFGLCNQTSRAN